MSNLPHALRNLRHLYEQLLTSGIGSQPAAAKGLLGPAIEVVERVETEVQRLDGEVAKAREGCCDGYCCDLAKRNAAEVSRLKAGLVEMRENWRRFDVRIAADIDALIGKEST